MNKATGQVEQARMGARRKRSDRWMPGGGACCTVMRVGRATVQPFESLSHFGSNVMHSEHSHAHARAKLEREAS